ncbi:MAG TPA: dephospho-CoA kinase [Acidimicrobiales bacterium]|nr:dephospho-CoA kinase [Acidimicrobiales bacterium]
MTTVGLTGSIGSGKSTVARLFADRGAAVLDADEVTRELQRPGEQVYEATVARFGTKVVGTDGELDRSKLADLVFADPAALADLEALTHPAVHSLVAERAAAATNPVVVLVVPLLLEVGHYEVTGVVVVDCPIETVVRRLAEQRGMAAGEVRARLARQLSREERLARADFVIDNSGPPDALVPQVDRAWTWILGGAASDVPAPR